MKRIKPIKALVGSSLILAMFLSLTGVASANHTPYHGDNPTVRVDTGAVIWEVKVDVKELDYYLTARWHGDHSLKSYYQSSGKPFDVKYLRLRAKLWSSKTGKDGSWTLRDEVYVYRYDINKLEADTNTKLVGETFLDNYGRAYSMGYFESFAGTIWAMHLPWGKEKIKPLARDTDKKQ